MGWAREGTVVMDDDPGNYKCVAHVFPLGFNSRVSLFVGMGLEALATMAYGAATRVFFSGIKNK